MTVSTYLLPSVSAVTASYTFKSSHLGFNRNFAVSRNKTLCNIFSTYYAHHIDLIIVVYRVFDWRISRAIFHFISFYFVFVDSLINCYLKEVHRFQVILKNVRTQIGIALYRVIIFLTFRFSRVAFVVAVTVKI